MAKKIPLHWFFSLDNISMTIKGGSAFGISTVSYNYPLNKTAYIILIKKNLLGKVFLQSSHSNIFQTKLTE